MQVPERILFFLRKMSVSLLITLLFPNISPGTEFHPEDTQPAPAEPPAEHKETVNTGIVVISLLIMQRYLKYHQ